jgi:sulfotransferase family protein
MDAAQRGSVDGSPESPIFVVGPSRSGTTLVRRVLNCHSDVSIAPETHYFDDLRPRLGQRAVAPLQRADKERVEHYFLALSEKVYGHEGDPSRSTIDVADLRDEARSLGGTADAYFAAFCRLRMRWLGRSRWGEKTPRHVFRIDDMRAAWPEAQVVCIVRDPRAAVASYRDWKRGKEPSNSADRARVTRSYNVVLNSLLVKGAMVAEEKALRDHGSGYVRLVRYEDVVSEPEAAVRALAHWLGLEYEPAMLDVPDMFSSYDDVQRGISTVPVERWRRKLSPTEISVIQTCCRGTMERNGYSYERVSPPLFELMRTWLSVPVAAARAAVANRKRLGSTSEYILRRLRLALSRGGHT